MQLPLYILIDEKERGKISSFFLRQSTLEGYHAISPIYDLTYLQGEVESMTFNQSVIKKSYA